MRAWERFLSGTPDPGQASFPVRRDIQDSWGRCASIGVDCRQCEAPIDNDKATLAWLHERNDELLLAARPSFLTVGHLLHDAGAMLVLADGDGVLLDVIGDKKTIHDGMDIHLGIGGRWTEDVAGTNGIGTALWSDRPVFVHAAEHFCAGIKSWTCAAAPVHDPFDGKVVGVIDLSGHPDIFRPHNIALVASIAEEVTRRIAEHQNSERIRLLEAFVDSAPRYRRQDGVMIIDRQGRPLYMNNVSAERLGALLPHEAGNATKAPTRMRRRPEIDLLADITANLSPHFGECDLSPLRLDGDLQGVALIFPEARSPRSTSVAFGAAVQRRVGAGEDGPEIIGHSRALREAVELAQLAAESPNVSSLLIEGETGTGKELIVRLIHAHGKTSADAPFVALNCGAITRELFGSELFGHVGGAFTGATREGKAGVLERAHGGLLSLDEIGEMPLDIQPFLLRTLEERTIRRIGDSRERPVNVRVVASTNRDLRQEASEGRFRWDLYYRISAILIRIPPLRDREDDALLLADFFSHRLARQTGGEPLQFSDEVERAMRAYAWPGNVRELRNLVERLHLTCRDGVVTERDLPPDMLREAAADSGALAPLADATANPESQALRAALEAAGGNLSQAAHLLGISRPTLYRRLDQHGIRRSFVQR
ncbi:sigma-54-dependent Fis family transcriptional regulator [Acidisoma sp. 7E03]